MPITPSRPTAPESFDYQPLGRVVFGPGTLSRLGELARDLGGTRVLLVTDPGLETAGHPQRAVESLRSAGLAVAVFDERRGESDRPARRGRGRDRPRPPGRSARRRRRRQRHGRGQGDQLRPHQRRLDRRLPGLRQGDQADAAVDRRADHGRHRQRGPVVRPDRRRVEPPEDGLRRQEGRLPRRRPRPGSDAHAAADGDGRHRHRLGRPRRRRATSAPRGNALSQTFSRQAWNLLNRNFERVLHQPDDLAARADMQLGAHLAGMAIETSMLGCAHACANPLTAHYGMTHGVAVGVMLPHVIRFNAAAVDPLYAELAQDAGLPGGADALARRVTAMLRDRRLADDAARVRRQRRASCRCWPRRRPSSGRPGSTRGR